MGNKLFAMKGSHHTQDLAECAVGLRYEDIPKKVVEKAKIMILHTIGCSIAARNEPLAQKAILLAKENNGGTGGSASLWLGGDKLSVANAAFANAVLSDVLDWEDCAWTGHPSAGVIPAALAVAEAEKVDGKRFLEAVVTAYEVYIRIAMAIQPPSDFDHCQGWALYSWQIFAATAAAAKLYGLDAHQTNQAYGMACMNTLIASNLMEATMSESSHYLYGTNAQLGILAARTAQLGFDNLEDCFDTPYAFVEHLTTTEDPSWYTRNFGKDYYLLDILVKHWPANMWIQTPMELLDHLVKEHSFQPEDIEEIVIDPPTQYRMYCYEDGFTSLMEAQFSMPYMLAVYLLNPIPGQHWLKREYFTDPQVLEIAKRIKSGPSPEHTLLHSFELFQAGDFPEKTVTVTLKDGTVLQKTGKTLKGHPEDMFTWREICALFRQEVGGILTNKQAEDLIRFVENLEDVEDMSQFNALL